MSDPLLRLDGLEVSFAGRGRARARAVDGVDLELGRGEIVALVGESGCGKTTLARTVLGLERPSAGRVLVEGVPLSYRSRDLKAWRRRVQLVPQDPSGSLNPRRTVGAAVAEGPLVHGLVRGAAADALVLESLARAGLRPPERFASRYPHELSGGQRQRILIAGALALAPDLLVADEPVSSLDASVRGEVLALLLRLRDELGLAILVVTHDLGLAWNIADRVAVMYLGRIVEQGTVEDVLRDPRHPYTQALLSVVPEISQRSPMVLAGEPPDPTAVPDGCRFHPRCPALSDGRAAAAGITEACRHTPLPVLSVTVGAHAAACLLDGSRPPAPIAPMAPAPLSPADRPARM